VTTVCIIPARYDSSRLPGKPLVNISGKPMIQWVYENAIKAEKIDQVIVATDHEKIKQKVESFGGNVVMTDSELASGTDRVAAAAKNLDVDIVINLQGDEPFIEAGLLDKLVSAFYDEHVYMATPIGKINERHELINPSVVKVVKDKHNYALIFSRNEIPYLRDIDKKLWLEKFNFYKHIGIYAYRKSFLNKLTELPVSALERAECLEQLRALENGYKIYTVETEYNSISVDTPEDLKKINQLINDKKTG
jgi:3-deoxy-manno-octulosonate cytidylyltransferase (CMP-KDO synthetase)